MAISSMERQAKRGTPASLEAHNVLFNMPRPLETAPSNPRVGLDEGLLQMCEPRLPRRPPGVSPRQIGPAEAEGDAC